MSDVAQLISDMVRSGVDPEIIGRTAAALAEREPVPVFVPDEAAERRRAADRERKRLRKSAESAEFQTDTLPSKELPQTPKETQPSPSTHKENPLRGQKKASRLPAEWVLPFDWRQDAISAGLHPSRIDLEADKLRDWSRSSKNGAKLDWRATWRNWCREAASRGPPRGSPTRPDTPVDVADRLLNELRFANGHSDPPSDSNSQALVTFPGRAYAGQR